jgi:hypothetical protein
MPNRSIAPPLIAISSHARVWFGSWSALAASSRTRGTMPIGSWSGAASQHAGPVVQVGADPGAAVHQDPK